jgi:hypothetical protein
MWYAQKHKKNKGTHLYSARWHCLQRRQRGFVSAQDRSHATHHVTLHIASQSTRRIWRAQSLADEPDCGRRQQQQRVDVAQQTLKSMLQVTRLSASGTITQHAHLQLCLRAHALGRVVAVQQLDGRVNGCQRCVRVSVRSYARARTTLVLHQVFGQSIAEIEHVSSVVDVAHSDGQTRAIAVG